MALTRATAVDFLESIEKLDLISKTYKFFGLLNAQPTPAFSPPVMLVGWKGSAVMLLYRPSMAERDRGSRYNLEPNY